jgi:hypothetical protein
MSGGRPWTAADEYRLGVLWPKGVQLGLVAAALDRSPEAIRHKLRSLGIYREHTRYSASAEQEKARDVLAAQIAGHRADVAAGRAKPWKHGDLIW